MNELIAIYGEKSDKLSLLKKSKENVDNEIKLLEISMSDISNIIKESVDYENYQVLAHRTFNKLSTLNEDVCHLTFGIIGEFTELSDAIINVDNKNIREECGDILWYISNFCTIYGLSFEELLNDALFNDWIDSTEDETDNYTLKEFPDFIKRVIAYGVEIDLNILRQFMITFIRQIYLETYWRNKSFGIKNILAINIHKLFIRYHKKFTKDEAINRDTTKEVKTFGV